MFFVWSINAGWALYRAERPLEARFLFLAMPQRGRLDFEERIDRPGRAEDWRAGPVRGTMGARSGAYGCRATTSLVGALPGSSGGYGRDWRLKPSALAR